MSWWPFKQKTEPLSVSFLSLLDHLEDIYPIYPSPELVLPWMAESEREGADRYRDRSGTRRGGIPAKCSGIVGLHQRGWIIQSWCDIVITTNGDGHSFKSHTALPVDVMRSVTQMPPVGEFHAALYGNLPSAPLPANTLKSIVKIHLPWTFRMTPGWGLLMLPLEYVKEPRFTSAIGVINPKISPQLHSILYWHVLNGQTVIKAGTPLCRVLPINLQDKWTSESRRATPEEQAFFEAHRLFTSVQYQRPHGVLGRFYERVQSKLKR